MKVVILAAGRGTRLGSLTSEVPKVMVEINGKPFLYYVLKNLKKAGYDDFCIVVGYMKEKVIGYVEGMKDFKVDFVEQVEQKGTGHALLQSKDFVGEDDFLAYHGDNLFSVEDLKRMSADGLNYVAGVKVENPSLYGVLVEEDGLLKEIQEKPTEFVGELVNAGLYKFTSEVFWALDRVEVSLRGEIELTDAVSMLASAGKVKVIRLNDFWLDLGCKEDIERIEKFLK